METYFCFQNYHRPGYGRLSHLKEEPVVPARCDLCQRTYGEPDLHVEIGTTTMGGRKEICPSCIRKGPKVVAEMARQIASPENQWRKLVRPLKRIDSFKEIPGGITAMKIAEAFDEITSVNRKGQAA